MNKDEAITGGEKDLGCKKSSDENIEDYIEEAIKESSADDSFSLNIYK